MARRNRKLLGVFGAWTTWISLLLSACASTPRFTPSQPVDDVPSLPEGMLLCAEYRVPVIAGARPIVLKPFLNCLNTLESRFPNLGLPVFPIFLRELRLQYGLLREELFNERVAADYQQAILAVLRALWRGRDPSARQFTPSETLLVKTLFPLTAEHLLAALVPHEWAMDPELERLRALATARRGCEPAEFATDVEGLGAFWEDMHEIEKLDKGPNRAKLRERYQSRLQAVQERNQDRQNACSKTSNHFSP